MPYQRQGEIVLAMWRAVERLIDAEPDGAPVDPLLRAEADRLRDEYHALIEAARARHRPELPPFPGGSPDKTMPPQARREHDGTVLEGRRPYSRASPRISRADAGSRR